MQVVKHFFVVLLSIGLVFPMYAQTHADSLMQLTQDLPMPLSYVNDYEGIFSEKEELTLDSLISIFRMQKGFEMAVLTLDANAVPSTFFDELVLATANKWGVGDKKLNNGITIGISKSLRKIRIANGLGVEKWLSDAETKNIIDFGFIPSFKMDAFYEGTYKGLSIIMEHLEQKARK